MFKLIVLAEILAAPAILARRPMKVAVLAQAAKNARIAWAALTSGKDYKRPAVAAH